MQSIPTILSLPLSAPGEAAPFRPGGNPVPQLPGDPDPEPGGDPGVGGSGKAVSGGAGAAVLFRTRHVYRQEAAGKR